MTEKNPHRMHFDSLEELNKALIAAGKAPINRYIERRACGCAIVELHEGGIGLEFCDDHKHQMIEEFDRTQDQRPPGDYIISNKEGVPIHMQRAPDHVPKKINRAKGPKNTKETGRS